MFWFDLLRLPTKLPSRTTCLPPPSLVKVRTHFLPSKPPRLWFHFYNKPRGSSIGFFYYFYRVYPTSVFPESDLRPFFRGTGVAQGDRRSYLNFTSLSSGGTRESDEGLEGTVGPPSLLSVFTVCSHMATRRYHPLPPWDVVSSPFVCLWSRTVLIRQLRVSRLSTLFSVSPPKQSSLFRLGRPSLRRNTLYVLRTPVWTRSFVLSPRSHKSSNTNSGSTGDRFGCPREFSVLKTHGWCP